MNIDVERKVTADFPITGKIYFHNDGVDAVEAQLNFAELDEYKETFEEAFEGLKDFMYEVELKIKLFEDGRTEILEVNGKEVDNNGQ